MTVCGLPGVGKSTVTKELAARLDAASVRTDGVRRDVLDERTYADAEAWLVYGAALERARARLADGHTVVLDGTFKTAAHRSRAADLGAAHATADALVWVTCDEAVARTRIDERRDDPSEADIEVYDILREEFEPPEDADLVVDNSDSLASTEKQLAAWL